MAGIQGDQKKSIDVLALTLAAKLELTERSKRVDQRLQQTNNNPQPISTSDSAPDKKIISSKGTLKIESQISNGNTKYPQQSRPKKGLKDDGGHNPLKTLDEQKIRGKGGRPFQDGVKDVFKK